MRVTCNSGACYNMAIFWLECGALESPEAMADDFDFYARKFTISHF